MQVEQVLTIVVRGEDLETELRDELVDAQLPGPDPLAAELDDVAVAEIMVEHPTADAVSRFQHDRVRPGRAERTGRGQTREPPSDNDDIGVQPLAHRFAPRPLIASLTASRQHSATLPRARA